jgi:hypothetical protein
VTGLPTRNSQRDDPGQCGLPKLLGIPQINRTLRIQPELRAISEEP